MAKVTGSRNQQVDRLLDYLIDEWQHVQSVAEQWATWDEYDQLDFDTEWSIRQDRLHQLRDHARAGRLSTGQRERLHFLEGLIERYQPWIDRLLGVE